MNLPQQQTDNREKPLNDFQIITRLIAINALMEAAKSGRDGNQLSTVTNELVNLARDAAEGDPAMTEIVEKQIIAIQGMAAQQLNEDKGTEIA